MDEKYFSTISLRPWLHRSAKKPGFNYGCWVLKLLLDCQVWTGLQLPVVFTHHSTIAVRTRDINLSNRREYINLIKFCGGYLSASKFDLVRFWHFKHYLRQILRLKNIVQNQLVKKCHSYVRNFPKCSMATSPEWINPKIA